MNAPAKITTATEWYTIDVDGQPDKPGWYECLYEGEAEDIDTPETLYWDGYYWRLWPGAQDTASFGNYDTAGERWRGAATPHGGFYV